MLEPSQARATGPDLHHERPFLFPWNRRIRNLHGISLRNLNTERTTARVRGKTISDDDLPQNLVSPAKRTIQHESRRLSHSRSFTSLSTSSNNPSDSWQKTLSPSRHDGEVQIRPVRGRLRRRSTLHWSNTHPRLRQTKLEDVTSNHLADTWFSIHSKHASEPIYISEIMEKSMNPSFAFFDLDAKNSQINRDDELRIMVWSKDGKKDEFDLLIDLNLNMRSLEYIGRSLENFYHPLPQNCVLLHLSDGIYTSFTDLASTGESSRINTGVSKSGNKAISSSFDALMQLENLDECVHDALKTRAHLEADINRILDRRQAQSERHRERTEQQEQISALKAAVATQQRQNNHLTRRKSDLLRCLEDRREAIKAGQAVYEHTQNRSANMQRLTKSTSESLLRDSDRSDGQLRRIAETLLKIFPIEPVKNKTLQFTIHNIHLPNSSFDDTNRDEIAAGLGFTSQLVHQLSFYLVVPLPYPLEPNSSNSFIYDPISVSLAQRRFPLHPITVGYKFEYAVFLLNKDIEFLMNRSGLRVLDIRHTLPNLKYLLYVLTAGTGDLPIRKAGGFRGLIGERLTPSLSRRSSEDSVVNHVEHLRRGLGAQVLNGNTLKNSAQKEKDMDDEILHQTRKISGHVLPQHALRDMG